MGWKEFTYHLVSEFCNTVGLRTFTLQEFYQRYEAEFAAFAPQNQHTYAKVRQQLQVLRDEGLLTFVDNHGTYTLRGVDLLRDEVDEPELVKALPVTAREREYLVEIRARDRGWVRLARHTFGEFCLVPQCSNTFVKEDGTRYVEVHHIEPLSEGGEEQIWNLAVICAHHHRVAHYAREAERLQLRAKLLETTQRVLTRG
ncbi:MAG TPA: HNH endonuclease [Armatimonadota bacterium]|jgi:5-methylcytosine-specific restriction endonuclease McrA